MKEFTLKNRNFLLVEVPDDAEYKLIKQDLDNFNTVYLVWTTEEMNDWHWEDPIKNDCSIIGKLSDILKDEHICSELVDWDDWSDDFFSHKYQGCFRNYQNFDSNNEIIDNDKNIGFDKATDSFHSFLQSQQIDLTKNYL